MKVLDLFSGLGGFSQAFKDRKHEVITVDIESKFNPTFIKDIFDIKDLKEFGEFDVILASPPCNNFSIASVYRHWKHGRPKDEQTLKSIELMKHTLKLIKEYNPKIWILENPRGMLRKQVFMNPYDRREITYCKYGMPYMKPTDLWGRFPKDFIAKKCLPNSICHKKVRRGSNLGVQGIISKGHGDLKEVASLRALVPYNLSLAICLACEKELLVGGKK